MSTVRVRHPETGAETDVPESALPILRQSGWETVSKKDAAAAEKAAADEVAEADRSMTEAGLSAVPPENRPSTTAADVSAEGKSE